MPTRMRHRQGCFAVPMVHNTILIDLRSSEQMKHISYSLPYEGYSGPEDDIIMLSLSAQHYGVRKIYNLFSFTKNEFLSKSKMFILYVYIIQLLFLQFVIRHL